METSTLASVGSIVTVAVRDNIVDIELEVGDGPLQAEPSDDRTEVLKVLDVPFDGKQGQSKVLLVLHEGDAVDARLRTLAPQQDGTARIFDLFRGENFEGWESLSTQIIVYLHETHPELPERQTFDGFVRRSPCFDIQDVALQWNQSIDTHATRHAIATKTTLKHEGHHRLKYKRDLVPLMSSWSCLKHQNMLLAFHVRQWPPSPNTRLSREFFGLYDLKWRSAIHRLAANNGYASMGNGSREQFTKLLVLDFFASNVLLSPATIFFARRSWPEVNIILDYFDDTTESGTDIVKFYAERLRMCERVLKELQDLAEAIDFVVRSLLKDSMLKTGDATGALDPEKLIPLQELCHQRLNNTKRWMDRLNRSFEAQDRIRNIEESTSVKRLTILATIFLPLWLSASILSMDNQFIDLKLKLYDFVGVFVVVGTAAVLVLLIVRTALKFKASRYAWVLLPSAWADRLNLQMAIKARFSRRAFALIWPALMWVYYCLLWAVVLVSFIIGMVVNVSLGLKILGFGWAGLLAYAIGWWSLVTWFSR